MNTGFGQPRRALRSEDKRTLRVSAALMQISIQRPPDRIHQVDITRIASLVPNVYPTDFWTDVGMLNSQPGDITHSAASPIAQREKRLTARIIFSLHQTPQDVTLIGSQLARRQQRLRRPASSSCG